MVYHGFWFVSIVLLVENTTKLYPGPTIQSRPCRPKAGFGLVVMMVMMVLSCALCTILVVSTGKAASAGSWSFYFPISFCCWTE